MTTKTFLKDWRNPHNPLTILGVVVLYFAAARVGLLFAYEHSNISLVWPPTGIALGAVIILGPRIFPAIFLGAFLANYSTNLPLTASFIVACGNTLHALAGGYLIQKYIGKEILSNARNVFVFLLLGGPVASFISATVGTSAVDWAVYNGKANFFYLWLQWWLGDSVGTIVVAPLILVFLLKFPQIPIPRFRERILMIALIAAVSVWVFTASRPAPLTLAYLIVPLVVAAAFRYELPGAAVSLFVLSTIAIGGTSRGLGPFAISNLYESLFMLQTFVGVVAATTLGTAAVVTERRLSQEALKLQLKEKDVLFSEIQHRVKNNLQVVCSMLSIQASKSGPDAAESLRQASSRVRSMAMIHERLTSSENLSNIDLGLYVQDLAREICQSHGYAGKLITNINGKVISTNLQKAVPCGLILNEIITNSLKHAFTTDYPAEIELSLQQDGTTVVLEIGDNGIGLHSVPALELDTVGMKLITILTKQLDGQLTLPPGQGTHYVLKFTP